MKYILCIVTIISIVFTNCTQPAEKKELSPKKTFPERKKPMAPISYRLEKAKSWWQLHKENKALVHLVTTINRTDSSHLKKMDSIIIPSDTMADISFYLPFPVSVSSIKSINKIIFFSYPSQTFAAYENGEMVYTGATNMGRKKDTTPTGLFFTNWKAEKTTSTFNDEWELKWNFNIANKLGVGWHEYEMPGYPASHSCLRLQEKDARYLYSWADQWELDKNEAVQRKGTPVIIFGEYPFDAPRRPWFSLIADPHALDISESQINAVTAPFIKDIEAAQQQKATEEKSASL